MKLNALLQTLHTLSADYGEREVLLDVDGFGVHLADIKDVRFRIKSPATKDGFISLNIGDWINYDHR